MRRKLIGQGLGGCTVSLPIKWVRANDLKPGDSVEVHEMPRGELSITTEAARKVSVHRYTRDIDGMNKYQINKLVRGLYKSRVDEIVLTFSQTKFKDLKRQGTIDIYKLCESMTRKLIGLEITQKEKDKVVFQCFISREDAESTKKIEKRIFLMIKEFMSEIVRNADDITDLQARSYDIHDNISKFCEYYMRIIVYSDSAPEVKAVNYHLVSMLDKTVDFLRYVCDEIKSQGKIGPKAKKSLADIFELFDVYYRFFYSIGGVRSADVTEKRYTLVHALREERFTINEYKILTEAYFLLHIMNDFHEAKRIRETEGELEAI